MTSFIKRLALVAPLVLSAVSKTQARLTPPKPLPPKVSAPRAHIPIDQVGNALPNISTVYYFDQLIDHSDPSKGTFQQRYWTTWPYYKAGGPIVLFTPGEDNAEDYIGYLTNETINGLVAQQENGATVVVEHRFFGLSNPYNNLSVESLQLLTLDQATADLAYFAKNVKLPMPGGDDVAPGKAPWVLIGGSYSGALTSWTLVQQPGVFWAGYASSAVVEAQTNFWAYFEPTRLFMAQNCSADVQAVVAHVDSVFTGSNQTAIDALKANFGMQEVIHLDDVSSMLQYPLFFWQDLQPDSGGGDFFTFCDALEVKDGENAPAAGWGLDYALEAWGSWYNTTFLDEVCGTTVDLDSCVSSYIANETFYTDISVDNADRSWFWFVCNQVGWYQTAAPEGHPTLVSRLIGPAYEERTCDYYFPGQFKVADPQPTVNETNKVYEGWDVKLDRIFFANGQRDPWRYVTVSSGFHNVSSTEEMPIAIGDGFHCSDLLVEEAAVDETIAAVQAKGLSFFKTWLKEWKPSSPA